MGEVLRIEEAARRAPFPVFVATSVPQDVVMYVWYRESRAAPPRSSQPGLPSPALSVYYWIPGEKGQADGLWFEILGPLWLKLTETAALEPAPQGPESIHLARFSRGGQDIDLWEHMDWTSIIRTLRLTRDGTRIEVTTHGQTLDEALAIAASLRPVTPDPP